MTNHNSQRKSFLIYKDSLSILDKLSDEQAGKLFKSIKNYQNGGEIEGLDFALEIAITPFIAQFERDAEKYKNVCEARRIAGSQGGKQKVANASKCKQKVANLADSDSDSDKDIKDIPKGICKKTKNKQFKKPNLEEIKNYSFEKNLNLDCEHFLDHYESNGWRIGGKTPMKDWKAALRNWARNHSKFAKSTSPPRYAKSSYSPADACKGAIQLAERKYQL